MWVLSLNLKIDPSTIVKNKSIELHNYSTKSDLTLVKLALKVQHIKLLIHQHTTIYQSQNRKI